MGRAMDHTGRVSGAMPRTWRLRFVTSGGLMRIVIDTADHPQPARLMLQLEALLSVHDPEPRLTLLTDGEPV